MIRLADKNDLHEISELWAMMVNELKPDWNPNKKAWIELVSSLIDIGNHEIVICIKDSRIVGFIEGLTFYDSAFGGYRSVGQYFFILPEYRDTDVSELLYAEILVQSLKNKAESIELYCLPEKEQYWNNRGFQKDQLMMRMVI